MEQDQHGVSYSLDAFLMRIPHLGGVQTVKFQLAAEGPVVAVFGTCFAIIIVGRTCWWIALLSSLTSTISQVFINIMSPPTCTGKLFVPLFL